jgi:alpha-L-fucosidase 2
MKKRNRFATIRYAAFFLPMQVVVCLLVLTRVFAATHSFNQNTGVLDVDYARYLSKHSIVYNSPITDARNALTVGNGRVGAMVWNAKGLTLQVSGVDASEQSCFSSGWVTLSTSPGMETSYGTFQQYLSLYDGTIHTWYDANRHITIFGKPNSEIMGIHVDDKRTNTSSVTVTVGMWDPATQMSTGGSWNSMGADLPDLNTWKNVSTYATSSSAGISRGQTDVNNFGYTLSASVENASYTTKQLDSRTVQLTITPSASYTIWIVNASRVNASGNNSINAANAKLAAVTAQGYAAVLAECTMWWHAFWQKSFVQFSNQAKDADYLETYYYLATYLIASGSFAEYPFHFINGVYKSNADSGVHWSGAYWYWNQRDVYDGFLAANHPDVMSSLYRLYTRVLPKLTSFTQSRFSIDGAWTPETMRYDGDAKWSTSSTFTDRIMSTGAEIAYNMYLRFAYTNDSVFLKDTAYPIMKESAKFLAAKLSYDNGAVQYYMANSNAHETYWGVQNALTDLAAVRMLFPRAIEVSRALNVDGSLRTKWQEVLTHLAPFKTEAYNGGNRYLPHDPPTSTSHNGENITCELLWPYDITGTGKPDYQTAVNSFTSRPSAYSNVWSPDPIQAARLGRSDDAFNGMKLMLQKYQNYPNGFTNNSNGVFEYIGVHILAMNESLLQSHFDTVRVFPAVPADPTFNGKFTLAAKGGFLVSSEKQAGEISYVGVSSLYGNNFTLANPWPGTSVQVRATSDQSIVTTTSGAVVSFPTSRNGVYVVERTSKKLDSFSFASLVADPNGSEKTMHYNNVTCILGSGTGNPVGCVNVLPAHQRVYGAQIRKMLNHTFVVAGASASMPFCVTAYSVSGRRIARFITSSKIVDLTKFNIPAHEVILFQLTPVTAKNK